MSEHDYLELMRTTSTAPRRPNRTGTWTSSLFAERLRFRAVGSHFPLLTTKEVHWKSVVYELAWFLRGDTNIKYLNDNGVRIWDPWADEDGELGPVYGAQWRDFGGVDQIDRLVKGLRDDPYSRRHIVNAWNVGELDDMALPPCHMTFQCYVRDGCLDLQLYQRSADIFLGVPFNIASYALLMHLLANTVGLYPGTLTISFGDVHLYSNHRVQAATQLTRTPRNLPILTTKQTIDEFAADPKPSLDSLELYHPHPKIKAKVAV